MDRECGKSQIGKCRRRDELCGVELPNHTLWLDVCEHPSWFQATGVERDWAISHHNANCREGKGCSIRLADIENGHGKKVFGRHFFHLSIGFFLRDGCIHIDADWD